jgi:hypothetical protein
MHEVLNRYHSVDIPDCLFETPNMVGRIEFPAEDDHAVLRIDADSILRNVCPLKDLTLDLCYECGVVWRDATQSCTGSALLGPFGLASEIRTLGLGTARPSTKE